MRIARVQGYRNRQALVKVCFTLIVLIFTYRAFTVSDIQANDITLKTKASKNSEFSLVDKSMRGNILDRNDNLLAINLIHKKINLDPMIIQDEYIDLLADALEIPIQDFSDQIENKRAKNRKYFIVKDKLKVNEPVLKNISELNHDFYFFWGPLTPRSLHPGFRCLYSGSRHGSSILAMDPTILGMDPSILV